MKEIFQFRPSKGTVKWIGVFRAPREKPLFLVMEEEGKGRSSQFAVFLYDERPREYKGARCAMEMFRTGVPTRTFALVTGGYKAPPTAFSKAGYVPGDTRQYKIKMNYKVFSAIKGPEFLKCADLYEVPDLVYNQLKVGETETIAEYIQRLRIP